MDNPATEARKEFTKTLESGHWMICLWRVEGPDPYADNALVTLFRETHDFPYKKLGTAHGLFVRQLSKIEAEQTEEQGFADLPKPPKPTVFSPEDDNGRKEG